MKEISGLDGCPLLEKLWIVENEVQKTKSSPINLSHQSFLYFTCLMRTSTPVPYAHATGPMIPAHVSAAQ